MMCEYQKLPCFYNEILNLHWSNSNQMVSDKATVFTGRFYIVTLKVMGEMRKFILQVVFFPA
jgi:hypothetical protein